MARCKDCKVGPGKFEGEGALAFMAYSGIGNGDFSTFDEYDRETEWFRAPLNLDTDGADEAAKAYGYCGACVSAASGGFPEGIHGGVSLHEDDNGFVYLTRYKTREAFDKALGKAEALADAQEGSEE